MGYQVYLVGHRYGGYGVPAVCEYPACEEEIDRGMAFACGGEPFSEYGCDRYFCGNHRTYAGFDEEGLLCGCDQDVDGGCTCTVVEVCERCAKGEPAFDYKPEHPDWVRHILKDRSWKTWRKNNFDKVAKLKKRPAMT
jgi:hypothetical protein